MDRTSDFGSDSEGSNPSAVTINKKGLPNLAILFYLGQFFSYSLIIPKKISACLA